MKYFEHLLRLLFRKIFYCKQMECAIILGQCFPIYHLRDCIRYALSEIVYIPSPELSRGLRDNIRLYNQLDHPWPPVNY